MKPKFTYISWGAGKQSTCLVEMANEGTIKCDAIFFADTQDEPYWVYDTVEFWQKRTTIPIHVVTRGRLSDHTVSGIQSGRRFASIPAFVIGEDGKAAPIWRQCTQEYKIAPIEKEVRRILGYGPGRKINHQITSIQGISLDECDRMRDSQHDWLTHSYPLIDMGMRVGDCIQFFLDRNLPVPRKSSCRYCPYHSDSFWAKMKANDAEEFEKCCEMDELIRIQPKLNSPVFIHRSLTPLRTAYFGENQQELFREDCSGHCGV